jgi:RNA polymerase sigma factor (sigma-70 family)
MPNTRPGRKYGTKIGPNNKWKVNGVVDYDRVIKENIGLIGRAKHLKRIVWDSDLSDEATTVGMEALCRAAELWNPEISAWSTYAMRSILSRFHKLRKDATKHDRERNEIPDYAPPSILEQASIIDQDMYQWCIDGFTERERECATLLFSGMTLVQVGEILGVTKERVRQIILQAVKRVRDEVKEMGLPVRSSNSLGNRLKSESIIKAA